MRQLASGEFIGIVSPTDLLAPNALAEMADHILRNPEHDLIYSDEDCISPDGKRHGLRLKPEWSPEMLLGFNYIGRLCLIRSEVLEIAGGFDARFEGAQEFDAILRVSEKTNRIGRVPRCLYHRRAVSSCRPDLRSAVGQRLSENGPGRSSSPAWPQSHGVDARERHAAAPMAGRRAAAGQHHYSDSESTGGPQEVRRGFAA